MSTSPRANTMARHLEHTHKKSKQGFCQRKWKNICVKEICKIPDICGWIIIKNWYKKMFATMVCRRWKFSIFEALKWLFRHILWIIFLLFQRQICRKIGEKYINHSKTWHLLLQIYIPNKNFRAIQKGGQRGGSPPSCPTLTNSWSKNIFSTLNRKTKFSLNFYMWIICETSVYLLTKIYISDMKYIAFSEFVDKEGVNKESNKKWQRKVCSEKNAVPHTNSSMYFFL